VDFGQLVVEVLYILEGHSYRFLLMIGTDPYTADGYLALMDKFKEEQIPLAVSVLDMDW